MRGSVVLMAANINELLNSNNGSLYASSVKELDKVIIEQALISCDNNQVKAALKLGINRNTLRKKMKLLGIIE